MSAGEELFARQRADWLAAEANRDATAHRASARTLLDALARLGQTATGRTFGVELEGFTARQQLDEQRAEVATLLGAFPTWRVASDDSVRSELSGTGKGGVEVKSPGDAATPTLLLRDEPSGADLATLRAVLTTLHAGGWVTSPSCGLHVHVGIEPTTSVAALRRLAAAWAAQEPALRRYVHAERRDDRIEAARPLGTLDLAAGATPTPATVLQRLHDTLGTDTSLETLLETVNPGRQTPYRKFSLNLLPTRPDHQSDGRLAGRTVENRLRDASIADPDSVVDWDRLTLAVVDRGLQGETILPVAADLTLALGRLGVRVRDPIAAAEQLPQAAAATGATADPPTATPSASVPRVHAIGGLVSPPPSVDPATLRPPPRRHPGPIEGAWR